MKRRREVVRSSVVAIGAGLGGCLSSQDPVSEDDASATTVQTTTTEETTETSADTESPATLDYSVDDLLVSNETEEPRTVEVTVSPRKGDVEPFTDEFELDAKGDDAEHTQVYPDLKQMSVEAQVTLDVSEFEPWSHAWQGDAVDDHLGLHVYIEEDGLEVGGKVA